MTEVGFVENSDKLYLCQVLVAADDVRQVVTGLRKHVPIEGLLNKKVVVITNLKVCPRSLLAIGRLGTCASTPHRRLSGENSCVEGTHQAPDG